MTPVKALLFDVFGTVVDWRGTIIDEGQSWNSTYQLDIDWAQFADEWRAGYQPSLALVREGVESWVKLDVINRRLLDELLVKYKIEGLNDGDKDHINRVWHRLKPWPDVIEGLQRLRSDYIIATLSNGNLALLTNMAKSAGLPWDCILSSELAWHYKPDAAVYLTAADLLDLEPANVMMVAAHQADLDAAAALGFKTAFVERPLEYGPNGQTDMILTAHADYIATSFIDLANQLTT